MINFLKKFYAIYRPFRWAMIGMLGFTLLGQVLNLAPAFVIGGLIDQLIKNEKSPDEHIFQKVGVLLGALLALQLFQNVWLRYMRECYELRHIDRAIPFHVSTLTLSWLLSLSPSQHQEYHSNIKHAILDKGQRSLADVGRLLVYEMTPMVCEVCVVTIALFFMHPALGCIVLCGIILFVLAAAHVNRMTGPGRRALHQMAEEQERQYSEIVTHVELVIASAQEGKATRECLGELAKVDKKWVEVSRLMTKLAVFRDIIVDLTKISVITFGVYLVLRGDFGPGSLVVFTSWSLNALNRMGRVGSMQRELTRHFDHLQRFFGFTELKSDVTTVSNPISVSRFKGKIEFRDVGMTYPRQPKPALSNVSFTIAAGECVALVGESGAGKTTITRALLRYQDPTTGQILVDDHDLRLLDLRQFRTAVGRVEQEVVLFDATLRYNLTFGLGDRVVTDEEILRVCKLACIDRFLPRLPKGLDTIVGERGQKLSGGEKQRVGIARALLKNPAILIFDEATSSLDAENEYWIQLAIAQASVGRTTIIIAHRFSTIKRVDRTIVFEKGKVVGAGTHNELQRNCPQYRKLVKRQLAI